MSNTFYLSIISTLTFSVHAADGLPVTTGCYTLHTVVSETPSDGKPRRQTRKGEDPVYDPHNMEAILHDDLLRDETVSLCSQETANCIDQGDDGQSCGGSLTSSSHIRLLSLQSISEGDLEPVKATCRLDPGIFMGYAKKISREKMTILGSGGGAPESLTGGENHELSQPIHHFLSSQDDPMHKATVRPIHGNHAHVMMNTYRKVTIGCPHRVDHI
jgi:hypothetical protein